MASAFRIPKAPLNMRSWLSDAAGLRSRGYSNVRELPLAQKAVLETALEVAAGG